MVRMETMLRPILQKPRATPVARTRERSCGVGACGPAPFGRDWHSRGYSPAWNFSAAPLVLRWKKRLAMGMAYGLVASSLAPATRVAVSDPEALIGSNHTSITRGRRLCKHPQEGRS
jgi:hypothetical protein